MRPEIIKSSCNECLCNIINNNGEIHATKTDHMKVQLSLGQLLHNEN